jgi:hypothetical protein
MGQEVDLSFSRDTEIYQVRDTSGNRPACGRGVSLATAAMMLLGQMQGQSMRAMAQGGYPYAGEPVLVGEQGPEVFIPDVPGTIIPGPISRFGAMTGDFFPSSRAAPAPPSPPSRAAPLWGLKAGETTPTTPYVVPADPAEYLRDAQEGRVPIGLPRILSELQQSPETMLAPYIRTDAWDRWIAGLPESGNIEDRRTPEASQEVMNHMRGFKGWNTDVLNQFDFFNVRVQSCLKQLNAKQEQGLIAYALRGS